MAKVNSKGMVSGTAGSVIYRNYRGMNILQGKPRKFEQTDASVRASTEFGLSSSAAGIIRAAFQPAYLHRDGEAAARCTQLVYRSIRNSLTASVGQRDLHDGDLSCLRGLEFNNKSKLSEIVQVSREVSRDEQGRVVVTLGAIDAATAIRPPSWVRKDASRYRLRFSLIGFNFRNEYYEYLEFRDLEFGKYAKTEAQQIVFNTQPPKDQMLLLSMTLMVYSEELRDGEAILLNSREFSPCALIAAFAAEEAVELPGQPLDQSTLIIPEARMENIVCVGYQGNRLISQLAAKIRQKGEKPTPNTRIRQVSKLKPQDEPTGDLTGKRVSFKKT